MDDCKDDLRFLEHLEIDSSRRLLIICSFEFVCMQISFYTFEMDGKESYQ